jgi:hypothetical protein
MDPETIGLEARSLPYPSLTLSAVLPHSAIISIVYHSYRVFPLFPTGTFPPSVLSVVHDSRLDRIS